jgi:alpha-tubulin suppressor-like RCC1 family protein
MGAMESLPRLLLGGACAVYLAQGCGSSFSADGMNEEGSAGASSSSAGQGGTSSSGGSKGDAGENAVGGDEGSAGDGMSGSAGTISGAGGNPGVVPCVIDPDADGSCAGAIAAGSYSTCAIRGAGAVRCWGYNVNQRLGDGVANHEPCSTGNEDCSRVPVSVEGVSDAYAIAGGENSFCMLNAARELWCWGWDVTDGTDIGLGSLKRFGDFTARLAALRFPLGAVDESGRVWMAGYDDQGRGVFGDGPTSAGALRDFGDVALLQDAVGLDVGWYHSCAVLASQALVCWGKGVSGEIGDGEQQDRPTPTSVMLPDDQPALAVAVGDALSCALGPNGEVWCWGGNDRGQLGNGQEASSAHPVAVQGLTDAVEIDAGFGHACARRSGGTVVCWGNDRHGQLGDSAAHENCSEAFPEPCSRTPVQVGDLDDAVAISLGTQHSCALRASGDVVCWGFNAFGQLGDGTFADAQTPVTTSEL